MSDDAAAASSKTGRTTVPIVETSNGDNIATFALAHGLCGKLRSRPCRAPPAEDFMKIVGERP